MLQLLLILGLPTGVLVAMAGCYARLDQAYQTEGSCPENAKNKKISQTELNYRSFKTRGTLNPKIRSASLPLCLRSGGQNYGYKVTPLRN
jgi:hypothetical protein